MWNSNRSSIRYQPIFKLDERLIAVPARGRSWNRQTWLGAFAVAIAFWALAINSQHLAGAVTGRSLVVMFRCADDLDAETREWIENHVHEIQARIRKGMGEAGIDDVRFVRVASRRESEAAMFRGRHPVPRRGETLMPGLVELVLAGRNAGFHRGDSPLGVLGFTNSGRAAVFMDAINFRHGPACDEVCVVSQVALHEIGHALGFEAPAHNWLGISVACWFRTAIERRAPDIMEGSRPIPEEPRRFNMESAVNQSALIRNTRPSPSR